MEGILALDPAGPIFSSNSENSVHAPLGNKLWKRDAKAVQGRDSIEKIGLSFGLKNGLRFHFDSETCLNYPFLNIFLVWGISSQNSGDFSSQNSSQNFFY